MGTEKRNEQRRKFLGGFLATCVGALCLSGSKKSAASEKPNDKGQETLYRRTRHVKEYLQTLND